MPTFGTLKKKLKSKVSRKNVTDESSAGASSATAAPDTAFFVQLTEAIIKLRATGNDPNLKFLPSGQAELKTTIKQLFDDTCKHEGEYALLKSRTKRKKLVEYFIEAFKKIDIDTNVKELPLKTFALVFHVASASLMKIENVEDLVTQLTDKDRKDNHPVAQQMRAEAGGFRLFQTYGATNSWCVLINTMAVVLEQRRDSCEKELERARLNTVVSTLESASQNSFHGASVARTFNTVAVKFGF